MANRGPRKPPSKLSDRQKLKLHYNIRQFTFTEPLNHARELASFIGSTVALVESYLLSEEYMAAAKTEAEEFNAMLERSRKHVSLLPWERYERDRQADREYRKHTREYTERMRKEREEQSTESQDTTTD